MSETTFTAFAALAAVAFLAICATNRCTRDRTLTDARNAACAERGGRLLLGQDGSHVCVDPRGVKWEKKP